MELSPPGTARVESLLEVVGIAIFVAFAGGCCDHPDTREPLMSKPPHGLFAVRMSPLPEDVGFPMRLDEPLPCLIIDPVVQEKEDRHV